MLFRSVNYAKAHRMFTVQYSDGNTGETKTSTRAFIKNLGNAKDGDVREFTVYCEDVAI